MASKNETNQTSQSVQQPRFRRWIKPNDRAENFANELKAKVHIKGKKAGQPLTEAEIFLRKGALLMQSNHAGIYKYKKASKFPLKTKFFRLDLAPELCYPTSPKRQQTAEGVFVCLFLKFFDF